MFRPSCKSRSIQERSRETETDNTNYLNTRSTCKPFPVWLESQRAKGDAFGYCLALAFHTAILLKWRSFPASHFVYFICYIAATLAAFSWQRSGKPSYAVWRNWIQAIIRLECFFSPVSISFWQKAVQSPPPVPPIILARAFPSIPQLLAFPVAVANTMVMHLVMLPLVHTLSFWPHVAVQLVCVGWVLFLAGSMQGCATPFFRHPTTRCLLGQAYEWLQLLTLFTPGPLPLHGRSSVSGNRCNVAGRWFQVMAGFVLSVLFQAMSDAQAYSQWIKLQHDDSSFAHTLPLSTQLHETPHARVLQCLAASVKRPLVLLVVAAVVWDVLCLSFG